MNTYKLLVAAIYSAFLVARENKDSQYLLVQYDLVHLLCQSSEELRNLLIKDAELNRHLSCVVSKLQTIELCDVMDVHSVFIHNLHSLTGLVSFRLNLPYNWV